jgi:hypothetical protein
MDIFYHYLSDSDNSLIVAVFRCISVLSSCVLGSLPLLASRNEIIRVKFIGYVMI